MVFFFCIWFIHVPRLINFLTPFTSLFPNPKRTFTVCLIIWNVVLLLFRSSALIGSFHLLSHRIALFPHFPYSVDVCVYMNVYLIWCLRLFASPCLILYCTFLFGCFSPLLHSFPIAGGNRMFVYIAKWNGWCPLSCRITMKRQHTEKRVHSFNEQHRRVYVNLATWLDFKINPFYTALYQIL